MAKPAIFLPHFLTRQARQRLYALMGLTRVTAHSLQEAQHHGLLRALQPPVAETVHDAANEPVALLSGEGEIDRYRAVQKGLQLRQGLQLSVVHLDHHAMQHDRSQLPAQTHTPLENVVACQKCGASLESRMGDGLLP